MNNCQALWDVCDYPFWAHNIDTEKNLDLQIIN